uniref:Uncharacterized protein n=1 Tax=Cannabis sativa TaxID=3483 RepID=A0A803NWX0_CANSA
MNEDDHQDKAVEDHAGEKYKLDKSDPVVLMARQFQLTEKRLSRQDQFNETLLAKMTRMEAVMTALTRTVPDIQAPPVTEAPEHTTEECRQLKDEIENLISRGYLRQYVRIEGNEHNLPNNQKNQGLQPPLDEGEDNLVIFGGPHVTRSNNNAKERYINEVKNEKSAFTPKPLKRAKPEELPIIFIGEDASHVQFPHMDPLVIQVQLANKRIKRVLIDNGIFVNIPYKEQLKKMGLGEARLKLCMVNLCGFTGDSVASLGTIELQLTMGEPQLSKTLMQEFLVIDIPSVYNILLGCPTLIAMGAISSIKYLSLKFPTHSRVATMKGDQLLARQCYSVEWKNKRETHQLMVMLTEENKEDIEDVDARIHDEYNQLKPIEELEEFNLYPNNPTKFINIGKGLGKNLNNN